MPFVLAGSRGHPGKGEDRGLVFNTGAELWLQVPQVPGNLLSQPSPLV